MTSLLKLKNTINTGITATRKGRTMDDTKLDKIISQVKADTAFETFKATLIKQALIDNVNPIPIYLDTINRAFSVEAQEAFATDWLMAKEKYEKNQ